MSLLIFGSLGIYVYSLIPDKPKVQDTFWGISLNASKADIKFIKGVPTKTENEDLWIYEEDEDEERETYTIKFKGEKIRYIFFTGSDWLNSPDIQGVGLHASPAMVRARFGEPSCISVSDDDLKRLYSYASYNVVFIMQENKVTVYGIYNSELGDHCIKFLKEKESQPKGNAMESLGQPNSQ